MNIKLEKFSTKSVPPVYFKSKNYLPSVWSGRPGLVKMHWSIDTIWPNLGHLFCVPLVELDFLKHLRCLMGQTAISHDTNRGAENYLAAVSSATMLKTTVSQLLVPLKNWAIFDCVLQYALHIAQLSNN